MLLSEIYSQPRLECSPQELIGGPGIEEFLELEISPILGPPPIKEPFHLDGL